MLTVSCLENTLDNLSHYIFKLWKMVSHNVKYERFLVKGLKNMAMVIKCDMRAKIILCKYKLHVWIVLYVLLVGSCETGLWCSSVESITYSLELPQSCITRPSLCFIWPFTEVCIETWRASGIKPPRSWKYRHVVVVFKDSHGEKENPKTETREFHKLTFVTK